MGVATACLVQLLHLSEAATWYPAYQSRADVPGVTCRAVSVSCVQDATRAARFLTRFLVRAFDRAMFLMLEPPSNVPYMVGGCLRAIDEPIVVVRVVGLVYRKVGAFVSTVLTLQVLMFVFSVCCRV